VPILISCLQLIVCSDDNNVLSRSNVHETPRFPTIDINEICDGVFFEARPFPGNSQFFVGCIRGGGVILQCHENELFDENRLKCMMDDEIDTTTLSTTTTTTAPPPDYDRLCEGLFWDFIEHPTDCGQAIFCYEQRAIVRQCPAGEIFDRVIEGYANYLNASSICLNYYVPPLVTVAAQGIAIHANFTICLQLQMSQWKQRRRTT
jgi:hypothetical protein